MSVWDRLPHGFFALAPMEDVTDTVFRRIIGGIGKPDIAFTEFTSAEGMLSKGERVVSQRLRYTPGEKPLIAQIWGSHPEAFFAAARKIKEMNFDGIDINMGCPERSVLKQGGGGTCITAPQRASELIQAAREGGGGLPVSVKTRIGFTAPQIETWIGHLLSHRLPALTIHLRTVSELSTPPAHWEYMPQIIQLRNQISPETRIIGNGSIVSREQALTYIRESGCDGVMIATGIFQNPWIFSSTHTLSDVTVTQRKELLLAHARLFCSYWGTEKPFRVLKKYFKIYCNGFDGAAMMRMRLMECESLDQVEEVCSSWN
jgi:tRNA-dihydrouridine synthase